MTDKKNLETSEEVIRRFYDDRAQGYEDMVTQANYSIPG